MSRIRLLLRKDLRILGRSPVLVAALIVYPLVFAGLCLVAECREEQNGEVWWAGRFAQLRSRQ